MAGRGSAALCRFRRRRRGRRAAHVGHAQLCAAARGPVLDRVGPPLGAALCDRRDRVGGASRAVVPDRARRSRRSVRQRLRDVDHDRLPDRHHRPQFRQPSPGHRPDRGGKPADHAGAPPGRRRLSHDLRLRASGLLRQHEVDLRPVAEDPARRGHREPRDFAARQPFRYGAQQHAARPRHVRCRPAHRRVEHAAERGTRHRRWQRAQGPDGPRAAARLRRRRHAAPL